jgi:signal transduction histidine kinase
MATAIEVNPRSPAARVAAGGSPATASGGLPWLKPLIAGGVLLFALLSLFEVALAFAAKSMPALHLVAVPIAVGIIVLAWFAELAQFPWPRLAFVAAVTAPNVWLAAMGHGNLNYLFLLLAVVWVTATGSPAEGVAALAINMIPVAVLGTVAIVANGAAAATAWIPWAAGLIVVWLMTRGFVNQQRLAEELSQAESEIYQQAREAALLDERQRLARELHDAVTQTLFASSLIADVLPKIWERDPAEGGRRLQEMRELTRGALAEMRALLNELRPAALVQTPLPDLLRQLTDAVTGRARLPVTLTVDGQGSLPPEVQLALYRIAQEALNNVVKHASAQRVQVSLSYEPNEVKLRIRDDGRGFDPQLSPQGHFGLGIMRERAGEAQLSLEIESRVNGGTSVSARWDCSEGSAEDV